MKAAILSFTNRGGKLNEIICTGLKNQGMTANGYTTVKYAYGTSLKTFNKLNDLMKQLFETMDGIIIIGACGIAVRAIASFLKSKSEDPGVLVIGEDGKYVISLLSGHIGGGNELCRCVAKLIGAVPVITTATDINNKFAADSWAIKNNLIITDISLIKEISGAVINDEKVGFYSEYPIKGELPTELTGNDKSDIGISISKDVTFKPFPKTLNLVPRNIVLGIGCRKDTEEAVIEDMVKDIFCRFNLEERRICKICSIDVKCKEEGILKLSETLQAEFVTYTAEELKKVPGDFNGSEFVRKTVGVDNVCERSAFIGSGYGKRLIPKTSFSGVTLSAYEKNYEASF